MAKANLIESYNAAKSTGKEYLPLNGLEFKEYLVHAFQRQLDGEHGLFSIGRAWPNTDFTMTITLSCPDENKVNLMVVGNTDPPDVCRLALGKVPEAAKPKPIESEFEKPGMKPIVVVRGGA